MTTPDGRPRPQYGEYATPEEQRARIKEPQPHMLEPQATAPGTTALTPAGQTPTGQHPGGQHPAAGQGAASGPDIPGRPPGGIAGPRQQSTSRGIDRVATLALLALGLYSVLSTLVTMTDLATYLDHTMDQIGMGSYTATATTGVIAAVISGVNIIIWLATAALSTLSLRAGRVSFWIPLVAGIVVTLITAVCYAILLMGDPSFVDYIGRTA